MEEEVTQMEAHLQSVGSSGVGEEQVVVAAAAAVEEVAAAAAVPESVFVVSILQVKPVKVVVAEEEALSSSGPKNIEVGAAAVAAVGDGAVAAALPEPALGPIHIDSHFHFDQWKMMLGG